MMTNNIKPIFMPKWGMEMSEGEINAWHVKVGDQVTVETDLVDVETAKIINTVAASDSGIVRAIVAEPGETHIVGALLGVIASAETSEEEINKFINSYSGNSEAVVLQEAPTMTEVANEASAPA
jgi:pyruvate dehydrogenase E2 component (dihydrolipoamide acetyltransferase)